MQILLARHAGFCFGVKRAVKIAEESGAKYSKVNTLGDIIHNPQVVNQLKLKGVVPVSSVSECLDNPVIIRSHGVTRDSYKELQARDIEIIDATCPFVRKAQEHVRYADKNDYQVYIYGDAEHPEVRSLCSFATNKKAVVISSAEEIINPFHKSALISQTTKDLKGFKQVTCRLVEECRELLVFNTICTATEVRQHHTVELAKTVDVMLIIGGKHSSNTRMLAKLSASYAVTHHIETAEELKREWFVQESKIGISAGASTPDDIIVEIYNKLIDWFGDLSKTDNVTDIPVH